MAVKPGTNRLGLGRHGRGRKKVAVFEYDSAVDSKATGEVTLRGQAVPGGAIITDTLIKVDAVLKSTEENKATVLLTLESEGDIQASKKAAEAPWSSAGAKRGAVTATGTPVITTAARSVKAKIGSVALTAGRFRVAVEFVEFT
jgi:hypothetical protein